MHPGTGEPSLAWVAVVSRLRMFSHTDTRSLNDETFRVHTIPAVSHQEVGPKRLHFLLKRNDANGLHLSSSPADFLWRAYPQPTRCIVINAFQLGPKLRTSVWFRS